MTTRPMLTETNWRAGHEPGGRSGPNHCQECSQRWPCDWAVLCEEVEERDARIAALTALARELAAGVHRAALHQPDWLDCEHHPCVAYRRVIEGEDVDAS